VAILRKISSVHWQARVRKANQTLTKTFINKADAEKWAKQVEIELDKSSFINLALAECTIFKEVIERYIIEVLPTMRWSNTDLIRLEVLARQYVNFMVGLSKDPKTKDGKQRIRAAHRKHSQETLEAKAECGLKTLCSDT